MDKLNLKTHKSLDILLLMNFKLDGLTSYHNYDSLYIRVLWPMDLIESHILHTIHIHYSRNGSIEIHNPTSDR